MSRQGSPASPSGAENPDEDTLDSTVGANYGVPDVDWGALKADMIRAANKLGDHLSVLKVRDAESRRFSEAVFPRPRASPA